MEYSTLLDAGPEVPLPGFAEVVNGIPRTKHNHSPDIKEQEACVEAQLLGALDLHWSSLINLHMLPDEVSLARSMNALASTLLT